MGRGGCGRWKAPAGSWAAPRPMTGRLRDLTTSLGTLGGQARNPEGLRPVDLARSVEILAGPEAAAALLRG